ncbi:hypothetical protein WJX72_010228 [[Myrmecia] bisecta]|uniref:2-oxoadipate dioxygenase/decarboxylase n=1 Tax=[Myrmecia] bisecta TaxID=41462 RepID=A0AAW1P6N7_9CHLO
MSVSAAMNGSEGPHAFALSPQAAAVAPLLQSFINQVLRRYWDRTPTAVTLMGLLQSLEAPGAPIYFDHLAFRTYGVDGFGIDSISRVFTDFGYTQRDELHFPAKKLRALWFAPPGQDSMLPRVFISELKVNELSPQAQAVINKYTGGMNQAAGRYAALCAATGALPWGHAQVADFDTLSRESEYAAWTLVNGYSLNHTTVSVHRLQGFRGGIEGLNDELLKRGFAMNDDGGLLKVSPDGGLRQSSTVADRVLFTFANGETRSVPGAYIEFAERLVLPQFEHLKGAAVEEHHRRDGFEVGNADKIFSSTALAR